MRQILENFSTTISGNNNTYVITYKKGEYEGTCTYVRYPSTRIQPGPILLMVECDMGDIIEHAHKISPLSSEDMDRVNMEIRGHSLIILEDYLKSNY